VISSTTSDRNLYHRVVVNLQLAAAGGISFWGHGFGHSADGLMRSQWFTRNVVTEKWFLHQQVPPLESAL
jgi:hypothetical protein